MGPDEDEEKSIQNLNRVISWTDEAITYDVDQRRADIILDQFQLTEASAISSLGTREEQTKSHSSEFLELSGQEASKYKMITTRLNHFALDRPDAQHATKEASKHMAGPKEHHWNSVKRSKVLY